MNDHPFCGTRNAKAMLLLELITGGFALWLENLDLGKLCWERCAALWTQGSAACEGFAQDGVPSQAKSEGYEVFCFEDSLTF